LQQNTEKCECYNIHVLMTTCESSKQVTAKSIQNEIIGERERERIDR
jgi:hypothetical protein